MKDLYFYSLFHALIRSIFLNVLFLGFSTEQRRAFIFKIMSALSANQLKPFFTELAAKLARSSRVPCERCGWVQGQQADPEVLPPPSPPSPMVGIEEAPPRIDVPAGEPYVDAVSVQSRD